MRHREDTIIITTMTCLRRRGVFIIVLFFTSHDARVASAAATVVAATAATNAVKLVCSLNFSYLVPPLSLAIFFSCLRWGHKLRMALFRVQSVKEQ